MNPFRRLRRAWDYATAPAGTRVVPVIGGPHDGYDARVPATVAAGEKVILPTFMLDYVTLADQDPDAEVLTTEYELRHDSRAGWALVATGHKWPNRKD